MINDRNQKMRSGKYGNPRKLALQHFELLSWNHTHLDVCTSCKSLQLGQTCDYPQNECQYPMNELKINIKIVSHKLKEKNKGKLLTKLTIKSWNDTWEVPMQARKTMKGEARNRCQGRISEVLERTFQWALGIGQSRITLESLRHLKEKSMSSIFFLNENHKPERPTEIDGPANQEWYSNVTGNRCWDDQTEL